MTKVGALDSDLGSAEARDDDSGACAGGTPSDTGFGAGWAGLTAAANPERWAAARRTWERHRRMGMRARARYEIVFAEKSRNFEVAT